MSTPSELWKAWEDRVIDQRFPLRQWLGGSERTAVFLTERGSGSQKVAIKLVTASPSEEASQLSRWDTATRFSHPHVLRLFEHGSCVIDGRQLLYVVMEYADEDLSQILPVRPLTAEEASETAKPAAEALIALHRAGLAHGSIKPSNILAVENQLKLSADSVGEFGGRSSSRVSTAYDAPEFATTGASAATDVYSLGATLVAVLTQTEPKDGDSGPESISVPETIRQPLRDITRDCLRDPQQRCTAEDILKRLQPTAPVRSADLSPTTAVRAREIEPPSPPAPPKRWVFLFLAAAVLLVLAWGGSKLLTHKATGASAESPTETQPPPAETSAEKSPAPIATRAPDRNTGAQGSVVQQVMPEISRGARETITGKVKVSVQVNVDASGKVSKAELVSAGPSRYFAEKSLAAAREWKFAPAHRDSQAIASAWMLRFQIGRASTQVFPSQVKP